MTVRLIGRSSSHFTRLVRIFALELGVAHDFAAVMNLASTDPADFAGNPALKLPILVLGEDTVFGAENICRALADRAAVPRDIIWPEDLQGATARNAHELVWHAMQAQVQLGMGAQIAGLPADNIYFRKAELSLRGCLEWLDRNLPAVQASLPPHDLSLTEAALFCLIEHLAFRVTVATAPFPALTAFARAFGDRASGRATPYRFDSAPA